MTLHGQRRGGARDAAGAPREEEDEVMGPGPGEGCHKSRRPLSWSRVVRSAWEAEEVIEAIDAM